MSAHATVRLTGREADALNTVLAVVLNDTDDAIVSAADRAPLGRVLDKLQAAIREAVRA